MNERSSRSHAVFMLTLSQVFQDGSSTTATLNLVDLAGSERVHRSNVTGSSLKEARAINQSLSALGNCIYALSDSQRSHIPYRDSKLTHLLKESLGGNTKTTLLINVSPSQDDNDESLSTLRFGACAKTIQNTVKINRELSPEELEAKIESLLKYISMIEKTNKSLRKQLGKKGKGKNFDSDSKIEEDDQESKSFMEFFPTEFFHLKEENDLLQQKLDDVETDLARTKNQLKAEQEEYEQKVESILEISESAASEIQQLRSRCGQLKRQLATAMANASEAEVDAANQGIETSELKRKLEKTQEKLRALEQSSHSNTCNAQSSEPYAHRSSKFNDNCNPSSEQEINQKDETETLVKNAWTPSKSNNQELIVSEDSPVPQSSPTLAESLYRIPKVTNIKELSQALRERRTAFDDPKPDAQCPSDIRQVEIHNTSEDFQSKKQARREAVRQRIKKRRESRTAGESKVQARSEDKSESYEELSVRLQKAVHQLTLQSKRIRTLESQIFDGARDDHKLGNQTARSAVSASPHLEEDSRRRTRSPRTRPSSVGDSPKARRSPLEPYNGNETSFMSRLRRTVYSRVSSSGDPDMPNSIGKTRTKDKHLDGYDTDDGSHHSSSPVPLNQKICWVEGISKQNENKEIAKKAKNGGLLRKLQIGSNKPKE